MMCVGALVVAAMIRQYEVWMIDDHPIVRADVVPGVMPDDPIVTFRIGQRSLPQAFKHSDHRPRLHFPWCGRGCYCV